MSTVPKSALPEHIDESHEWDGKDDDQHWYTKWRKKVKHWMAYGPRATEWWARWREYPKTLFAVAGEGFWRFETESETEIGLIGAEFTPSTDGAWYILNTDFGNYYITRVQLYSRWHLQIQWPLFIAFHWYVKSEDVLRFPDKTDRDGKLWFFYVGAKRDADKVYWCPAIYLGRNWK